MEWIKIEIEDIFDGLHTITAGDKRICVHKSAKKISACQVRCPHAGALLSSGYVDALGNIVCPVHHYRFSLNTGRNTSGEGYHLKIYHTEKREDGWYVQIG